MNEAKVACEIIRKYLKNEHDVFKCKLDDKLGYAVNGHVVYFLSDPELIHIKHEVKPIVCELSNYLVATVTDEYRKYRKSYAMKLLIKDTAVWIDVKYAKMFSEFCTFQISSIKSASSPVAVYEGDQLKGLIMPIEFRRGF